MRHTCSVRLERIAASLLTALALLPAFGVVAVGREPAASAPLDEAALYRLYRSADGYMLARDDARLAKAETLLREPAAAGYAWAQYNLSHVLRSRGKFEESARWARAAAQQGFLEAAVMLSLAYAEGKGVPRDTYQSCMWTLVVREQLEAEEIQNCHNELSAVDFQAALADARAWRLKNGQFKEFQQQLMGDGRKQGVMEIDAP